MDNSMGDSFGFGENQWDSLEICTRGNLMGTLRGEGGWGLVQGVALGVAQGKP